MSSRKNIRDAGGRQLPGHRYSMVARAGRAIAAGELPPTAGSLVRLFSAENAGFQTDAALRIAGSQAVTGSPDGAPGRVDAVKISGDYLFRAAWSLAGGSTEMSRNIVSERVLGMPREYAADRGVPFNQVPHGR